MSDVVNPTDLDIANGLEDIRGMMGDFTTGLADHEKKFGELDFLDKAKFERVSAALDTQEEKNQQLLRDSENAVSRADELKQRLDDLEISIATSVKTKDIHYKDTPEYKALNEYCRMGDGQLSTLDAEQKALLSTDVNENAGFLVPTEMDAIIRKEIEVVSNVRAVCRVRPMSSKTLEIPVRTRIPTATYEGEGETGGDDTSAYRSESVTAFRQTVTVPTTRDIIMNAAFDLESEIMSDVALGFAQGEGTSNVLGDGFKKPQGFNTDARNLTAARTRNSASAGTITGDDLLLLTGDLKTGYDPLYAFNRRTLAFLRTLKGSNGQYLWSPGLDGVATSLVAGFRYAIMEDMPDIASAARPIMFADFRRGYEIFDRMQTAVIRDEVSQKRKAIIEWTWFRWNTGQVIIPEAFKSLLIT